MRYNKLALATLLPIGLLAFQRNSCRAHAHIRPIDVTTPLSLLSAPPNALRELV
jgi:hypothetical protein